MSITVIVPVSPIDSHPDTRILAETVESIRYHHPTAEIFITFDGVRPQQEHLRAAYEQHIFNALWLADHTWGNVVPFIFDEHLHQTGMLRAVIDHIRTPYMMYVEHDTPLVTDEPIDWPAVLHMLDTGESNSVRFHHEAVIPDDHTHMMHGQDGLFLRTSQYSQRPHIATVAFYRRVLDQFSPDAKSFIEDRMYGVVTQAERTDRRHGWNQWRLHIYAPPGGNIKRSYHLDGRAGAPKWDDTQVF